ncbi:MAG: hypothetical protein JXM69_09995 [Anaerolineae bacterium]|nr:hypothetical protein [Anaerolineae bacterium]
MSSKLTLMTVFENRITILIVCVCGVIALSMFLVFIAISALLISSAEYTNAAPLAVPAFPDQRDSAAAAVTWMIQNHQENDGGYDDGFGSRVGETLDVILAMASAGYSTGQPYFGRDKSPLDFLQNNATDLAAYAADDGGPAGKAVLGLAAANKNARDFEGYNFVISVTNHYSSTTGQYSTDAWAPVFNHSLAMLALKVVSEPIPVTATNWLTGQQATAGHWDSSSVDGTAMAIMALVAAGAPTDHPSIVSATNWLSDTRDAASGGWLSWGSVSANSTALVVQALSALGEDYYSTGGKWDKNGNTPLSALLELQNTTGAFQADLGSGYVDDFYATRQSVPAVTGKPFPLPSRYEAAKQGVACLETLQDTAGPDIGGWEDFAGDGVNAGGTARAVEAIVVFGETPTSARWTQGGTTAVDALENLTPDYLSGGRGGRVGKVMQGVTYAIQQGASVTVTSFAGYNLLVSVTNYLSPTGEYADTTYGPLAHDEAMLGLIIAGYDVAPTATTWLRNAQQADGSWPDGFGGSSIDGSGASLNALGRLDVKSSQGIVYAQSAQNADGGWGGWGGWGTEANSTSEMAQGLVAQGQNPFAPSWSKIVGGKIINPADVIMAQQQTNGCWLNWDGTVADPSRTTDAIILLMQDPAWPVNINYFPLILKNSG